MSDLLPLNHAANYDCGTGTGDKASRAGVDRRALRVSARPPVEGSWGSSCRRTLQGVTKLGGLIGAVLLIALVLYAGDHIDWLADIKNDLVVTVLLTAVGVIGALIGSLTVGRFTHRRPPDTPNPSD